MSKDPHEDITSLLPRALQKGAFRTALTPKEFSLRENHTLGILQNSLGASREAEEAWLNGNRDGDKQFIVDRLGEAIKLMRAYNKETGYANVDAGNSSNYFLLGLAYDALGKKPEAIASYRLCVETAGLKNPASLYQDDHPEGITELAKERLQALEREGTGAKPMASPSRPAMPPPPAP